MASTILIVGHLKTTVIDSWNTTLEKLEKKKNDVIPEFLSTVIWISKLAHIGVRVTLAWCTALPLSLLHTGSMEVSRVVFAMLNEIFPLIM